MTEYIISVTGIISPGYINWMKAKYYYSHADMTDNIITFEEIKSFENNICAIMYAKELYNDMIFKSILITVRTLSDDNLVYNCKR